MTRKMKVLARDFQNRVRIIKQKLEKLDANGENVFLPAKKEVEEVTEEETEIVTEEAAENAPLELPEVPE